MDQRYTLREPSALLFQDPTNGAGDDEAFGSDCWPVHFPIELDYRSAAKDAPVGHAPLPRDPSVALLLGALLWNEAPSAVAQHPDPRGILVFDWYVVSNEIAETRLCYADIVELLAPKGFWIPTPASASALVQGILLNLSPTELEKALKGRERYPVQYATDEGWLQGLWTVLAESRRRRELARSDS